MSIKNNPFLKQDRSKSQNQIFNQADVEVKGSPPFAIGDFVQNDQKEIFEVVEIFAEVSQKQFQSTQLWQVAIYNLHTKASRIPDNSPFVPKNVTWVNALLLTIYKIESNNFPLLKLPEPALALVMHFLPLSESCQQSLVNKKFLEAFRSNVIWKHNCQRDIVDRAYDFEEEFRKQKLSSWFHFYQLNALWAIKIVTVFRHQARSVMNSQFTCLVLPTTTVEAFYQIARSHPKNRQPGQEFVPFDEAVHTFRYDDDNNYARIPVNDHPAPKNYTFDTSDLKKSIREAGLCPQAVLMQPERLKRD